MDVSQLALFLNRTFDTVVYTMQKVQDANRHLAS